MSTYFDHALNFFDSSLKKVEEIQQAAFQTEKLSKEEITQEVLWSSYTARYALNETLRNINLYINKDEKLQEVLDTHRSLGELSLNQMNKILPDNWTRPSLMLPLADIASIGIGVGTALMGKERCLQMLRTVEETY